MKEMVISNPNGITLPTKNTLVDDDIKIKIDKNLLGIKPSGKIEITTTEEIDVSSYEKAQVVDENLTAENIAKDVEILGVVGTFEGGTDTTDATATANDILKGKTAYGKEGRIVGAIETYDGASDVGSSGNEQEDGLIEGTLTSYTNDRVTQVSSFVFRENGILTEISLPNVTTIAANTFSGAKALESVYMPSLETISSYAFQNCIALKNVTFTNAKTIGRGSLIGCTSLQHLEFPSLTKTTDTSAIANCSNLISVDFHKLESTNVYMFANCYSLRVVIIRTNNKIANLSSTTIFNECSHILGTYNATYNPNSDKDGYFYVPREKIQEYTSNTNWSVYAEQFRALEDYTIDGTITGKFDFTKVGLA